MSFGKGCRIIRRAEFLEEIRYSVSELLNSTVPRGKKSAIIVLLHWIMLLINSVHLVDLCLVKKMVGQVILRPLMDIFCGHQWTQVVPTKASDGYSISTIVVVYIVPVVPKHLMAINIYIIIIITSKLVKFSLFLLMQIFFLLNEHTFSHLGCGQSSCNNNNIQFVHSYIHRLICGACSGSPH